MKRLFVVGMPIATLLLGAEIFGTTGGPDRQDDGPAAPTVTATVAAAGTDPAPIPVHALAARILARPLFAPARRPDQSSMAQPSADPKLPRLSGLISAPGGNYAIFQPEAAAPSVVAAQGAKIGEWTVQTITEQTVTISHDKQRVVLRTTFADAPAGSKSRPYSSENPLVSAVPEGDQFWAGRVGAVIGGATIIRR